MTHFLCFGKVASPELAWRNEGAQLRAAARTLGRQVALIDEDTPPLRLHSPGWMAPGPELIAALDTRAALRLLCHDRLEALVPGFAPRVREFCRSYLDEIARRVGPAEEGDEVCLPGDRFFAALLPLPSPKLASTDAASGWVEADLGFWDGRALTLIRFGSVTGLLPRQRQEFAALQEASEGQVRLLWLPLGAAPDALPAHLMDTAAAAPLPVFGPYRAAAFRSCLPDQATTL